MPHKGGTAEKTEELKKEVDNKTTDDEKVFKPTDTEKVFSCYLLCCIYYFA